jgi:NAD(P)-dependent dehydrogenase (short-subunit alcohol dehydrogenase family)
VTQLFAADVSERGSTARRTWHLVPVDVADADRLEAAAAEVEDRFGPIDVWVNNAMTSVFALFTDIEPAEFTRVTDVTYHGYVHGTRAALRRMLPRGPGGDHPGGLGAGLVTATAGLAAAAIAVGLRRKADP